MEITAELKAKLQKAVSVSMQIEGYSGQTTEKLRQQVKELMESRGVKVSISAR
ncbi:hypothetical protein JX580_08995 [Thiomicrospira microaerophila]|uniref:hypothetical protein n=1 Tax=Thiomicrospira microaerophila TaxID=406020 RepID=UPI00200F6483|nr:hypothetical protein [Thiomicrospira microaerophila]UQB41799.1 hypothetical protein JX580_08995 [Thiomicrospira microaerophila]